MKSSFDVRGLDGWLEDLAQAGVDVDDVVEELLEDAKPIAEAELHNNLRKTSEQWTGAAAETIFTEGPKREGNYTFIEIGADTGKDPAGFYKEFGTARQAAEPFIRPAFTKLRRTGLKQMLKTIAARFGLST